jgi:hypothetical protein
VRSSGKRRRLPAPLGRRAEGEVTNAVARLHIAEGPTLSSVLVKDVKSMLQTGEFEGEQIFYKNKRANQVSSEYYYIPKRILPGTNYRI